VTDPSDQDGASAVEYGLLIAGIATLIIAIVFLFGGAVANTFTGTCQGLSDNVAAHGGSAGAC
jgi:pilus assembly protein Flp/PilA